MTKVMIIDLKINFDIWMDPYDSIKLILKPPPKKNKEEKTNKTQKFNCTC